MKIYVISITTSLLAIMLNFVLKNYYLDILALLLVLSVGVLHGANDLLIIQKLKNKANQLQIKKYSFAYLGLVLLVLLLFYLIPWLILLAFILVSAYHFGEQQLQILKKIPHPIAKILFFSYGCSILSGLFYFNSDFTADIIYDLTNWIVLPKYFKYSFLTSTIVCLIASIYLLIINVIHIKMIFRELFLISLIFCVFYSSSLLFGFAIYFVFWHTLPSLSDQVQFIYSNQSKNTFFSYLKKALPFWMISLLGLTGLYYLFGNENMFLSIMFAFIAAITFPHVIVIERMFYKINSN